MVRKWLRVKVIDPETRDRRITWAYMIFVCAMLLHHVYVTMYFATVENGAITFRIPWVVLAGITFLMGRMWKDPCFWVLTPLLLLKVLRVAIPSPEEAWEYQRYWWMCIYAFYVCYGAGRVLSAKDRKTLAALFCRLWTLAMVVYACIGLYTVWSGDAVANLGSREFYIHSSEERLWPIYHPVEAGTLTAASIPITLAGFFLAKRRTERVLYIAAGILIFLMGTFCVSRIGYVLTAVGISAPASLALQHFLSGKMKKGKGYTVLRTVTVTAVCAGIAVLLIVVQMKAVPAYNRLRSNGGGLLAAATAEEMEAAGETEIPGAGIETGLANREFVTDQGINGFLTGRLEIWVHIYDGFDHYPKYAVVGQGGIEPMAHINSFIRYDKTPIYHFHSTFIQTLWENGVVGFLLFASFFGIFLWNAGRLFFDRNAPMWERVIPMPAVLCWMADLVDCAGYCNWGKPPMTILYFFAGLTIAIAAENRRRRKARKHGEAQTSLS